MIESKKLNIIMAAALAAALIITTLIIGFSGSVSTELSPMAYESSLFGDEIISIDIITEESQWDDMIANASAKTYIMVNAVVNGVTYENVGIRTKGNASLTQVAQSESPERYSLHLKFDEYISGQTCLGLDELILNNMITDTTYMKEYMSQDLMRYIGVEAPLTNYADISVNGQGFGFYVALESYGDSYSQRIYGDEQSNFYNVKSMVMGGENNKNAGGERPDNMRQFQEGEAPPDLAVNAENQGAEPMNAETQTTEESTAAGDAANPNAAQNTRQARMGGGGMGGGGSTGGSLEYTDGNLSSYSAIFDNASGSVSESDQAKVVEALKALSQSENLEEYFDVDAILRYFAAHTVLVSMDSYYSNMAQNYFLLERDGVITMLPWDYHLSYGGFQSGGASEVVNAPIDTPVSGVTMESRPMLNALLSNPEYLEIYHSYLQEIVDGYFDSGLFEETVMNLAAKIGGYVESDPSAYFSYDEFLTGVEALIKLNDLRASSIAGQLAGIIPSTTEGQQADSSGFIDTSSLNMSDLGTSSMGRGGGSMGGRQQAENADTNTAADASTNTNPGAQMEFGGAPPEMPADGENFTRPQFGGTAQPGSTGGNTKYLLISGGLLALLLIGALVFAARLRKNY